MILTSARSGERRHRTIFSRFVGRYARLTPEKSEVFVLVSSSPDFLGRKALLSRLEFLVLQEHLHHRALQVSLT
jgi:hypothetical protein